MERVLFLRAYLQYSSAFQVLRWESFLAARQREAWQQAMPGGVAPGASIWLRTR